MFRQLGTLFRRHGFTLCLLLALGLAVLFPGLAARGGCLQSEVTTKLGVWLIFFLQGLGLPTSELVAGYKPKRLHAFVLCWNYLFFPIVVGVLLFPLSFMLSSELRLGFWVLSILPTTVASAIAFTALAGGNTSNAIFSTVFSNLLSVLVVPLFVVGYLSAGAEAQIPLAPLFVKLSLLIVLPLIIGQVARKFFAAHAGRISKRAKLVSSGIILFIVHAAFANSMQSGVLEQMTLWNGVAVLVSCGVVLFVVSGLVWGSSAWLRLNRPERIAGFFCASQKSLATGLPLVTSILVAAPNAVDAASLLIPLICYHPLQLLLTGVLRFGKGLKV